jgi:hypothetical protein
MKEAGFVMRMPKTDQRQKTRNFQCGTEIGAEIDMVQIAIGIGEPSLNRILSGWTRMTEMSRVRCIRKKILSAGKSE